MIFTFPLLILASLSRWFAEGALTNDKVDFRKLNITSVPSMAVDPSAAKRITRVVFSHNSLEELRDVDFDTLSQFPNTRYIFFDNNRISQVRAGTFSRLPKLKHIELSRNDLTELSQDFYDELTKLTHLKYVNLKRNPFCNFDNIYRLMEKGIDVDFDGMMNKNRKRRLATESSVNNVQNNHLENSDELLDEDHENRTKTDKPRKAFVVDTKGKPSVTKNSDDDKQSKTMESIIFNLFTAGLILVALPIGMVIYFLMNRRREYS